MLLDDPIIQAMGRCNPDEPLKPGDARWEDFDVIRGTNLHTDITKLLLSAEAEGKGKKSHIALAGHRGCGKSTELLRVVETTRGEGYLPLYSVVNAESDPDEISFGDLFLLMLRLLDSTFEKDKQLKPLPDKTVKVVMDWFRDVTKVTAEEIERELTYSGEAGLGVTTPLAKLLFTLSAKRRRVGSEREETRQQIEKYPTQLRQNLNLLLDDAYKIAAKNYPRGFIFILDNLDRYTPEMIDRAVLRNADLFQEVNAHTLFTMPISLLYNPPGDTVEDRFDAETLPMLPLFLRSDPRVIVEDALAPLLAAIHLRVPRELFGNDQLARQVARLSGGIPRDVMHLLKLALLASTNELDERALRRAAAQVRNEYTRKLTLADFEILAQVHLDCRIDPTERGRLLLYRRNVLEYLDAEGERWHGVHPLLWETPEFKNALEKEKDKRGLPHA